MEFDYNEGDIVWVEGIVTRSSIYDDIGVRFDPSGTRASVDKSSIVNHIPNMNRETSANEAMK